MRDGQREGRNIARSQLGSGAEPALGLKASEAAREGAVCIRSGSPVIAPPIFCLHPGLMCVSLVSLVSAANINPCDAVPLCLRVDGSAVRFDPAARLALVWSARASEGCALTLPSSAPVATLQLGVCVEVSFLLSRAILQPAASQWDSLLRGVHSCMGRTGSCLPLPLWSGALACSDWSVLDPQGRATLQNCWIELTSAPCAAVVVVGD